MGIVDWRIFIQCMVWPFTEIVQIIQQNCMKRKTQE